MLKLLLAAALLMSACRPRRDLSQYTKEDPKSNLSAKLEASDTTHAAQFLSGFHQVEPGGWRWASNQFTVELRAPFASQKLGATLTLKGNLPEILFSRTGPIQLSAKLNQTPLPAQVFKSAGEVVYTVDIPPAALSADQILVAFTTDKSLPPNTFPGDGRQLALIVSTISLETKK